MSKILKHVYAGSPHVRHITAADFRSVGVQEQEKVVWSPSNQHTAEVSDEAAEWLLANETGDWEVIKTADDESAADDASTGDGESSSALGSDEDDDEIGDLDTSRSTTSRRRKTP